MRNMSIAAVTAGMMIAMLSGCASGPSMSAMRGQSTEGYARLDQNVRTPNTRVQQVRAQNYDQYYNDMRMDPGLYGGCDPYGCGHDFCAPPTHYKFKYVVPQGLNYPPPNAMPGVLQYPYYTIKGPDDFFHQ